LKGDKECEEHNCEALRYCSWHPNECFGKPWDKKKEAKPKKIDIVGEMDKMEHRESLGEAKP
jgi:hypothetical protein